MTIQHQEWKPLRQLLTKSLDQVEVELEKAQIPLPHQHEARLHEMDSPDFLPTKELHSARKIALASLGSLANLLKNPAERLMEISVQVSSGGYSRMKKYKRFVFLMKLTPTRIHIDYPSN